MKKLFLLFLAIFFLNLKAEPAPFGLIINKTTVEELKAKYPAKELGVNKNNGLEAFGVKPEHINFDGLLELKAAFSEDGILKMVQLGLEKDKFSQIFESLSRKYHLIYKNIPLEGNKEAKFEEGDSYIFLYALNDSDEVDCLYINKKLLDDTLQSQPAAKPKAMEVSQL